MKARWLTVEQVSRRYGVSVADVEQLAAADKLEAIEFPCGLRIDVRSLQRLERATRGRGLAGLPAAEQRVGRWSLPSGRAVEIFLSPPVEGVRRLRCLYDDARALDAADAEALQHVVLPEAAARIQSLTGRRGYGFLPTPP